MANSAVKGLTLGIVALFVVAAGLFFLGGHNNTQTPAPATETAAKADVKTAPATPGSMEEAASTGLTDKTSEADVMSAKMPDAPPATADDTKPTDTDASASAAAAPAAGDDAAKTDSSSAAKTDDSSAAKPDNSSAAKSDDSTADAGDDNSMNDKSDDTGGSLLASPTSLTVDIEKAESERVIGNDDAPVTIIEYASLTCPHCAHFDKEIFPQLKEQFLDTGKARLIFRDYPLDSFALKAAMMARCADPSKYFNLIDVIFKSQDRWIKAQDPVKALTQLGTLAGMDEKYIDACMNNAELESFILTGLNRAQGNYKVDSTPTFIFNSGAEKISGAQDIGQFADVINKLTAAGK